MPSGRDSGDSSRKLSEAEIDGAGAGAGTEARSGEPRPGPEPQIRKYDEKISKRDVHGFESWETLEYMERSDSELAREAQKGNREAYAMLVERYWSFLIRLARPISGDAEAEDLTQEALIVGWKHIGRLRDPAAIKTWLARITVRRCFARARHRRPTENLEEISEPGYSVDHETRIDVERLLMTLAPRQRAVMSMTVVQGMTDSEIAEVLGLRPASVRAHRRRARRRLTQILSEAQDARQQQS